MSRMIVLTAEMGGIRLEVRENKIAIVPHAEFAARDDDSSCWHHRGWKKSLQRTLVDRLILTEVIRARSRLLQSRDHMNGAGMKGGDKMRCVLVLVTGICLLVETSCAEEEGTCKPSCSPGYECVEGTCAQACNPPCKAGEICGSDKVCRQQAGSDGGVCPDKGTCPSCPDKGTCTSCTDGGTCPSCPDGGTCPSCPDGGTCPSCPDGGTCPSCPDGGTCPEGGATSIDPFIQTSSMKHHFCAVQKSGKASCWGIYNTNGELTVPSGVSFSQVSAGGYHSCGVTTAGTVSCWGLNGDGQASPPTGTFTQVSAGFIHSCGITTSKAIACWGSNTSGQLNAPAGTFSKVSSGGSHSCAIKTSGDLACWGSNSNGQATPPTGTFVDVAAGSTASCAVDSSTGSISCWGMSSFSVPAGSYANVRISGKVLCAVSSAEAVFCTYEKTTVKSPTYDFIEVTGIADWTLGYKEICGIVKDGLIVCWEDVSAFPPYP